MDNDDLLASFEKLKQDYRLKIEDKKKDLQNFYVELQNGIVNKEALLQTAHSLAGGCGMFGFYEISTSASNLETEVQNDNINENVLLKLIEDVIYNIDKI